MQIRVDETRCSGCRACELACVARHERRFGTATARIRVRKAEADGVDRPVVCHQCAEAPCIGSCPVGALALQTGTVASAPGEGDMSAFAALVVSAGDCIACAVCADACPFGGLFLDDESGMPLICDLCDGAPECVKRCVTGALSCAEQAAPARDDDGGGDRV